MTDDTHELLDALAALNAATATFSKKPFAEKLDRESHIGMTLMLLDVADRVLKRMVDGDGR